MRDVCGVFVAMVLAVSASAQTPLPAKPAPDAGPVSAPTELPRELALEIELQQTKEALVQTRADLARALNERLDLEARLLSIQLQASRSEVAAKAVKALGGDPDKGDSFDWGKGVLVRKGGKQ